MSNIRILIHGTPTMLREILEHAISNEPDMELVPEPMAPMPIEDADKPDVVVVGSNDSEPTARAHALLNRWPESHVLLITAGGHKVIEYELLRRGVDLGEMSPSQLVEAIRSAAGRERKLHAH